MGTTLHEATHRVATATDPAWDLTLWSRTPLAGTVTATVTASPETPSGRIATVMIGGQHLAGDATTLRRVIDDAQAALDEASRRLDLEEERYLS